MARKIKAHQHPEVSVAAISFPTHQPSGWPHQFINETISLLLRLVNEHIL
jgi:hypothetical protein